MFPLKKVQKSCDYFEKKNIFFEAGLFSGDLQLRWVTYALKKSDSDFFSKIIIYHFGIVQLYICSDFTTLVFYYCHRLQKPFFYSIFRHGQHFHFLYETTWSCMTLPKILDLGILYKCSKKFKKVENLKKLYTFFHVKNGKSWECSDSGILYRE